MPTVWYKIQHQETKLFWNGRRWHKDGKVYFSQDSIVRAFRNTNGGISSQNRDDLFIVTYRVEPSKYMRVEIVVPTKQEG
jgi:hypothetical protein